MGRGAERDRGGKTKERGGRAGENEREIEGEGERGGVEGREWRMWGGCGEEARGRGGGEREDEGNRWWGESGQKEIEGEEK